MALRTQQLLARPMRNSPGFLRGIFDVRQLLAHRRRNKPKISPLDHGERCSGLRRYRQRIDSMDLQQFTGSRMTE
jgi:hypothetical protein